MGVERWAKDKALEACWACGEAIATEFVTVKSSADWVAVTANCPNCGHEQNSVLSMTPGSDGGLGEWRRQKGHVESESLKTIPVEERISALEEALLECSARGLRTSSLLHELTKRYVALDREFQYLLAVLKETGVEKKSGLDPVA